MHGPLWRPSPERIARANLTRFTERARRESGRELASHAELHRWSVEEPAAFWRLVWSFADILAERQGETTLENGDRMPGARWFPGARLNFAENLLRRRDDTPAIVFRSEDRLERSLTYAELYEQVSLLAQAMRHAGVAPRDRVAAYMPNIPETVVAMLATASIGAVFSSCSPDFGVRGVVDRFGQIEPKLLFCADGYYYGGKRHDSLARIPEVLERIPSIEQAIVVCHTAEAPAVTLERCVSLDDFVTGHAGGPIVFEQLPFDHPLYVMYSSGTTGVPKCIVHGTGGTLLQHVKEHQLHTDVQPGDRLFYFTTCGWMMWNWLVSGLASEATLLLYDGSPFYPDTRVLFDFADAAGMSVFGTSAKYIDAVKKSRIVPRESHRLAELKAMLSTGSPLAPESFEFVYERIKPDLCLSSISGGTDIISCFVLGNPTLPVWRGEIQCRGLGMKVEVFDEHGRPVRREKGELVCAAPFPSMPIGFWNDPEDRRYRAAYFEKYPDVWCHGDYAELNDRDGVVIYGRSDAVLNPGGVRIGTAEIYRQVEQLHEVLDSLVIGQEWREDVRVVLFVRLREGLALDKALKARIKQQVRENTTPRHVPAKIIQIADIPRTKSGKIVELVVRDVVHGRPVRNRDALANPEALELFEDLAELQR